MTCKCKGTGRRDGFSEYLDCMEPGCNIATERAEFNKRLKDAGSMSVEDAAWWGYMQATAYRAMVEDFARKSGWTPSEDEGAFEWVQRKSYELGSEDAELSGRFRQMYFR